ncbi:unnamed protein product [Bursaphelenchus okinawaensis]|uniref:F-box domain-containing protein n=1 Tax=Bursaphelenchus okinawaensis TaxID=465554 RepID=A0A811KT60_9BILA|nr:unnamed protein product [Bursaphelenchus okinawaensis]CAG9112146.1 unnamed protein product [Bursaphelenchus okinawaensis]
MKIFVDRLEAWMWYRIIEHVTGMEDTCSLAMVNKYFYKLVKMGFKKLCSDHAAYRLEGATWASAFSE